MADIPTCSSSSSWPLPEPNPNSNSNPNPNPNPNPNSPNFNFLPIPQHEPSISPDESQFEDESDPYMYEGSTEDHEHDYEGIQDVESFANFNFSPSSSSISFLDNPNPNSNLQDSASSMQSSIPSLLHLSFNQDYGCFAVVTNHGFLVYNCDPFREIFRRNFVAGGIRIVEMLFRCNILALVSGDNKVMIWDDNRTQCIGELSFRSEVRAVRLRRDRIIVVLEQKILVYSFVDLKLLHQIETVVNTNGLCAVSQLSGSLVLVCPGLQKGQVRVEQYVLKRTKFIVAHDSRIACFALTQDGRILATASTKGTLVRIFETHDGSLLQEVRRGADRAEIYSLAFSSTAQWLAVSSDKGTVHVFSLKVNTGLPGNDKSRNSSDPNVVVPSTGSSLSFIKGVLPKYFSSEWSVAKFRINEGSRYIAAFGQENNTVVILGMDGSFYKCGFDSVTGGEMTQLEFYNFLKPNETL